MLISEVEAILEHMEEEFSELLETSDTNPNFWKERSDHIGRKAEWELKLEELRENEGLLVLHAWLG